MFNVGGGEILVILLIALLVLGPDRLPGAAREVGKHVGEFRRMSQSFQQEMRSAMQDLDATKPTAGRASSSAKSVSASNSPTAGQTTPPALPAAEEAGRSGPPNGLSGAEATHPTIEGPSGSFS